MGWPSQTNATLAICREHFPGHLAVEQRRKPRGNHSCGMDPLIPSTDYHVWLMRGRDKVWVGRLGVDVGGWGTVSLQLPESIIGFEKVELTAGNIRSTFDPQKGMVLEGSLVSMAAPRMVTYATLR